MGGISAYIISVPLSLLDILAGDKLTLLIPIGGFFGITIAAFNSRILEVQEQNKKIIKQNEELKALILDMKNKNEENT